MPAVAKKKQNSSKEIPKTQNTSKEIQKKKLESKNKVENSSKDTVKVISGQLQKQIEEKEKKVKSERGIVLVRNIPHGFYEEQMRSYFKQFGNVTRVRVVRSLKTGNSKGFGYVEFEIPEVAQIAAETMNNYLMFNKIVKTVYIPPEEQKHNYFKTSLKLVKNSVGKVRVLSKKTENVAKYVKTINNWNEKALVSRSKKTEKKVEKLNKLYSDLGLDFNSILLQENDKNSTTNEKKTSKSELTNEGKLVKNSKKNKSSKTNESKLSTRSKNVTSGNLKKEKKTAVQKETVSLPSTSNDKKKSKNKVCNIVDLLGESMQEEDSSSDEDFVPSLNNSVSDEETENTRSSGLEVLLGQTIDEEDSSVDEDFIPIPEDNSSEEESAKNIKPKVNKPKMKTSKTLEKHETILKRKPLSGGIQKQKQKVKKNIPVKDKGKQKLKSAALEIMKSGNICDIKKTNFKKQARGKK